MAINLEVGDVFLTRNDGNDTINSSPGYWNHSALYIGNDIMMEAQFTYGVIKVLYKNFLERYPIIAQLRHTNPEIAKKAAEIAKKYVGNSYWKISSIFGNLRNEKRGDNCVGLVRRCYFEASGQDYLYRWPDHIYKDVIHFKCITKKFDEKWICPKEPFNGIIVGP